MEKLVIHQEKPNGELIKWVGYGHKKELEISNEIFDSCYETGLDPLIMTLAEKSDADLSRVLNTLVRETKKAKAILEANKKSNGK